jgi:hypothetical protein
LGVGAGKRFTDVAINSYGDRAEVLTGEGPEEREREVVDRA